ncbi:MAG: bifunctional phosphopantothenoylcysteine decarboxylase/phosphopantothenate--cysteine ligase CoaBC [Acidobacteriota bacterium]
MRVLLGVTGCIAAYKAAFLLRLLQQKGIDVVVVMTEHAKHFVGPLTFEKLSGHPVLGDDFATGTGSIEHIQWARESDLVLVAPASANILGKFAAGIADDFLSTLYLATTKPVVVAPSMNVEMWRHPATQQNLEVLRARGVQIVEPEVGYQACGEFGEGRLAAPETIADFVVNFLAKAESLRGFRVLVTAGPTVEDLDAVRFISNRSSGKMGYAMAAEAARRGARVVLVSGPTHLPAPPGVERVSVRTAAEMREAVLSRFSEVDVVVKAAAVADYRPRQVRPGKRKKSENTWVVELEPTEDILAELGRRKEHQVLVGFAAETEQLEASARRKLEAKNLDLIVANDVSREDQGFASDWNEVTVLDRSGRVWSSGRRTKAELAGFLWDLVTEHYLRKPETASP